MFSQGFKEYVFELSAGKSKVTDGKNTHSHGTPQMIVVLSLWLTVTASTTRGTRYCTWKRASQILTPKWNATSGFRMLAFKKNHLARLPYVPYAWKGPMWASLTLNSELDECQIVPGNIRKVANFKKYKMHLPEFDIVHFLPVRRPHALVDLVLGRGCAIVFNQICLIPLACSKSFLLLWFLVQNHSHFGHSWCETYPVLAISGEILLTLEILQVWWCLMFVLFLVWKHVCGRWWSIAHISPQYFLCLNVVLKTSLAEERNYAIPCQFFGCESH